MANADLKTIKITPTPEINSLLDRLGIKTQPVVSPDQPIEISETDCAKAGVSFQFFLSFAKLTQSKEYPTSAAERLLTKKEPPRLILDDLVTLLNNPIPRGLREFGRLNEPDSLHFKERFLFEHIHPNLFLNIPDNKFDFSPPPVPNQETLDTEIDAQERNALVIALHILDENPSNPEGDYLINPSLVKDRVNALAKHPCWLGVEAMRSGLFGMFNGESNHQLGLISIFGRPLPLSESTPAQRFQCEYVSAMNPLSRGLFFPPQQMSKPVERASQSVVKITYKDGAGSGVVIAPNYILTALHVIEPNFLDPSVKINKNKPIRIKLTFGNHTFESEAILLPIPKMNGIYGEPGISNQPDLAVLYIPNLPTHIAPLPFSETLEVKQTFIQRNGLIDPTPLQTSLAYRNDHVFVIGHPHQRDKNLPKLVTPGSFDRMYSKLNERGMLQIKAIALPGDSGGATVDWQGRLVGITTELQSESRERRLPNLPPYDNRYREHEIQPDDNKRWKRFEEREEENDLKEFYEKLDKDFGIDPKPFASDRATEQLLPLLAGYFSVERRNIIGARIYPIALWGGSVREVIRAHQQSLKR